VAQAHRFHLVGGHVALDFVNTIDWRTDPDRRADQLGDVGDLVAWARQARLVSAAEAGLLARAGQRDGRVAARALARARGLREVLARVFTAASQYVAPADRDLRRLNAFLAAALRSRRIEVRGVDWVWGTAVGPDAAVARLLWPIVLAAAELLTSADVTHVRECAAAGCGWLFLDTSRSRRRRWCTMESCGNRAKARRFYERERHDRVTGTRSALLGRDGCR
jgi:predicted RNA-binding Zn ribbon-like protein